MTDTIQSLPIVDVIGEDVARLNALRKTSWAVASSRGIEVLSFNPGVEALEHKALVKGASFQRRLDEVGLTDGPARENWEQMLVTTEGDHRRALRRPFLTLLAGPQVKRLTAEVRAIIEGVLDEIDGDDVDLMDQLAWKVPSRIYCHLVGAPMNEAPLVARLSDRTLAPILTGDKSRKQDSIDAFNETRDFVRTHLAARRRAGLGEDFASIMIRQQQDGLQTEEELIFEGIALLQASVDNTVHQIGLALGTLLEDPARWQSVVEDNSRIPQAIEEAMRLAPRFNTIFRHAPEETVLNGLTIPADTWVFVSTLAANRDETVFREPSRFRLDRQKSRALQFGGGGYSCLGQTLARLEMQQTLSALAQRFPNLKLARPIRTHVTNAVSEVVELRARLS